MAIELADSHYLLILAPTLVIALMFLFFWLFMKETSYDEVLARQKRDQRPPLAKADARKKSEKKKNKKKESGGGGGESEEDLRDFDVPDATSSTANDEEPEVAPVPPSVAAPVQPEPPVLVRERKKKEKKAKAAGGPATSAPLVASGEPEVNGSKPAVRKEQPLPLSKQPSPPPTQTTPPAPTQTTPPAPTETTSKKKAKKQKIENEEHVAEVRKDQSPAVGKKKEEPVPLAEPKLQDGAAPTAAPPPQATPTTSTGGSRRKSKKQRTEAAVAVDETLVQSSPPVSRSEPAASANHQTSQNDEAPPPAPAPTKHGKKQKNETDKENSGLKLKEVLASLGGLTLSDAEIISVVSLLRDKSPGALDSWYKAAKVEPLAQQLAERERLLTTVQEEASIAKDKVKQLSQELQTEKQKSGRAEAMVREQRAAVEKDMNVMQAKAQGTYQELQNMQMKFQKLREQMEGQITRLQQENGILRDAVSSATNQMETKQSAELNKLRTDYAGLMKELTDTNNKVQQEELQRKSLEVGYKQNVSQLEAQLQDAKRRWEDLQGYMHGLTAEREKLLAAKQEQQNKLLAVETEVSGKNMEIQNLRSTLTDAMLSKEQMEQKMRQLLEASQHSRQPDDALQVKVQELMSENKTLQVQIEGLQAQVTSQANTVSHLEELQKLLAEKELQRKSLEDSLNAERSTGASRETNMQAIHNDNVALKAELQNLQAQIAEQASAQLALDQLKHSLVEKEEKIKTVEALLEAGLIEVANKEEKLKTVGEEKESLKRHVEALQQDISEQKLSSTTLEELQRLVQEKEEKIKSVEKSLTSSLEKESSRANAMQDLEKKMETLLAELAEVKSRESKRNLDVSAQLQELQALLASKDQDLQRLHKEMEVKAREMVERMEQQKQLASPPPSQDLLAAISEKDKQLSNVHVELVELRDCVELHKRKNNELREKNWSAMEALSAMETMLQGKLSKTAKEGKSALESAEAECRDLLHRLLPHVPLPTDQNHKQWLENFESSARDVRESAPITGDRDAQSLTDKLKEAEETQKILQKDCETYKKVLAETEGILQRLQSSVEQEELCWREKLEQAHGELREMTLKVTTLEQEVDRLGSEGELESLRREKLHLEAELERAERESATYVSEVRELKDLLTELQCKLDGSNTEAVRQNEELNLLKTQLNETLEKLETEERERQKVAGDLYKAQQSLERIQEEILKEMGQAELIQNISFTTPTEDTDRKEKLSAGLNQTVRELQELLHAVNRQLTKGLQKGDVDK
ncbi:kinectin isoform X3 [Brachyhypopomus gauderio]|uniref:kinectin isoform X3 n=1 Tax=Brachyhypopomus gauderio TaxID=698409 RepID=UPI0040433B29